MLSVILPTIRPALVAGCLAGLRAAGAGLSMEIVVVADFAPTVDHYPWIIRDRRGVVDAICTAYEAASGDRVFLTNDETAYGDQALRHLSAALDVNPNRLIAPRHLPPYPFVYYGKPFAPFACGTKAFFATVGGFFDPAYRAFYADPDLSLRVHAAGYPVEIIDEATITHLNDIGRPDHAAAVAAYLEADRATFRSRWDHLGEFRDP